MGYRLAIGSGRVAVLQLRSRPEFRVGTYLLAHMYLQSPVTYRSLYQAGTCRCPQAGGGSGAATTRGDVSKEPKFGRKGAASGHGQQLGSNCLQTIAPCEHFYGQAWSVLHGPVVWPCCSYVVAPNRAARKQSYSTAQPNVGLTDARQSHENVYKAFASPYIG